MASFVDVTEIMEEKEWEDWCFICKDGGNLILCDYKDCPKVYHASCIEKEIKVKIKEESFICPQHKCYLCSKRPKLYCLCCPHPVCESCVTHAEFIRLKENKGLCNQCVEYVVALEEIQIYNAAGDKIDLKDPNMFECLFLECWEITKKQEDLTFHDVQAASKSQKKTALKHPKLSSSFKYDHTIKPRMKRVQDDRILSLPGHTVGTKDMEFIGWGSKPLIDFLTYIGENTKEAMSQISVESVIQRYIRQKNLTEDESRNMKKKRFRCDEKLYSIFKKRSVNQKKIYKLLNGHVKQLEYNKRFERGFGVKKEKVLLSCKKKKVEVLSDSEEEEVKPVKPERVLVPCEKQKVKVLSKEEEVKPVMRGTGLATINTDNIKLVYLRKSFVVELLKEKESFEDKVVGSFVKVKNNPLESMKYQVLQVTGITANEHGVFLYVGNEISISKLDDNDISKEEIEDLKQKVMSGLLRQPTVAEMEHKVKALHEDITKHWIARELMFLQRRIDCANEKGRRRELEEYLDQREALQKPSEQDRLIKKVPRIIEDLVEVKRVVAVSSDYSRKQGNISGMSQEAAIEID